VFAYVSDIYGLVSGDNIYRFHFLKRGPGGSQSVLILIMVATGGYSLEEGTRN